MPRIAVPAYTTSPVERQSIRQVLSGTLHQDVHPPAYYLLMYWWTGLFGTDLVTLRLPSVLLGVATVALLYRLARTADDEQVARWAALLLALNGHHVFWSQHARMWVLIAFLAVLTLILLERLSRRPTRAGIWWSVTFSTLGLWTEYFFWPVFVAQVLWTIGRSLDAAAFPRLLRAQMATVTLSTRSFC